MSREPRGCRRGHRGLMVQASTTAARSRRVPMAIVGVSSEECGTHPFPPHRGSFHVPRGCAVLASIERARLATCAFNHHQNFGWGYSSSPSVFTTVATCSCYSVLARSCSCPPASGSLRRTSAPVSGTAGCPCWTFVFHHPNRRRGIPTTRVQRWPETGFALRHKIKAEHENREQDDEPIDEPSLEHGSNSLQMAGNSKRSRRRTFSASDTLFSRPTDYVLPAYSESLGRTSLRLVRAQLEQDLGAAVTTPVRVTPNSARSTDARLSVLQVV